jgi:hypothetical protein
MADPLRLIRNTNFAKRQIQSIAAGFELEMDLSGACSRARTGRPAGKMAQRPLCA